jgi:hypothetical protein
LHTRYSAPGGDACTFPALDVSRFCGILRPVGDGKRYEISAPRFQTTSRRGGIRLRNIDTGFGHGFPAWIMVGPDSASLACYVAALGLGWNGAFDHALGRSASSLLKCTLSESDRANSDQSASVI